MNVNKTITGKCKQRFDEDFLFTALFTHNCLKIIYNKQCKQCKQYIIL